MAPLLGSRARVPVSTNRLGNIVNISTTIIHKKQETADPMCTSPSAGVWGAGWGLPPQAAAPLTAIAAQLRGTRMGPPEAELWVSCVGRVSLLLDQCLGWHLGQQSCHDRGRIPQPCRGERAQKGNQLLAAASRQRSPGHDRVRVRIAVPAGSVEGDYIPERRRAGVLQAGNGGGHRGSMWPARGGANARSDPSARARGPLGLRRAARLFLWLWTNFPLSPDPSRVRTDWLLDGKGRADPGHVVGAGTPREAVLAASAHAASVMRCEGRAGGQVLGPADGCWAWGGEARLPGPTYRAWVPSRARSRSRRG